MKRDATFNLINTFLEYMNQDVIVGIVFLAALGYLVNVFWNRTRKSSHACGESCTGCSSINIDEIEKKIKSPLP